MIDLAALPDPAALDDDALLRLLGQIADDLDRTEAVRAYRTEVFKAARSRTPSISQRRLAEAARVSEPAVIQAIRGRRPPVSPAKKRPAKKKAAKR